MEGGTKMLKNNNLISLADRPEEERREIAKQGAAASNKAQARRKSQKELFLTALTIGTQGKKKTKDITKINKTLEEIAEQEPITYEEKIIIKQILRAAAGDTKAAAYIRDTIGEKPAENVEIIHDISPEEAEQLREEGRKEATDLYFDLLYDCFNTDFNFVITEIIAANMEGREIDAEGLNPEILKLIKK